MRLGLIAIALSAASAQEQTAFNLNSRGLEASSRGDLAEAAHLFETGIDLWRGLGPGHPRVASILSQEGLILMDDGKLSLVEKAMTQSLDILAKSCPGCIFEQTVSESNLGMLRMKEGRYPEADRLLTQVVSLQEQYGGPAMAATLRSLAQVREKERRHEDAVQLQKRADVIPGFR